MTEAQLKFSEEYAYKDIAEYEAIVGYKMNEAFRIVWDMARVKNKNLGIMFENTSKEP